MRWVLELEVFGENEVKLASAARAAGHEVSAWSDRLRLPPVSPETLFHGSLNVASTLRSRFPGWAPGAYCDADKMRWSSVHHRLQPWLLSTRFSRTTVRDAQTAARSFDDAMVFVRPDSPLKPFSGRALPRNRITPEALDFAFYFDDLDLPVILAPWVEIIAEWRFVITGREVAAGSAYDAQRRAGAGPVAPGHRAWSFAAQVSSALEPIEPVYVLDVCETALHELRIVELNPFSGADLYDCDPTAIVARVGAIVAG